MERCPSGRRYLIRNQVCPRGYQGFESPSLRQLFDSEISAWRSKGFRKEVSTVPSLNVQFDTSCVGNAGALGALDPSLRGPPLPKFERDERRGCAGPRRGIPRALWRSGCRVRYAGCLLYTSDAADE